MVRILCTVRGQLGYWFPDVKTMLKSANAATNKTKVRRVASGTSTNAAMRCPHTRKLKQSIFNPTKRNCSVYVTSDIKSPAQSSRVADAERRVVGAANPSEVIKSMSDVKALPEQSNNGSVKATSKSNRTSVSSKSLSAKRILLLELEALKNKEEIDEQLSAARRKFEIRRKQDEIDTLTQKLEIVKLEDENARTKQASNQEIELARNGSQLKLTQSQKVTKQSQPCKRPQDCYWTFKAPSTSTKPFKAPELRGRSTHSQKDMNGVKNNESHLRSNKELCFWPIDSKSTVGSHWRSNQKSVEKSSTMRTVKRKQPRQTSSKESSSGGNVLLKRKDKLLGKLEGMTLLEALDCTTTGKCTMKKMET